MKYKTFIPFVCGAGASTPGCEYGPPDLKKRGLTERISNSGWLDDPEVIAQDHEFGLKTQQNPGGTRSEKRREIVLHHCRYLRDKVEDTVRQGDFPVTLGGDHAMVAGSVAGLARAKAAHGKTGLIWFDTHADMNTPQTSKSGALHGMPLAALLGYGDPDMTGLGGGKGPVLNPSHIFQIGLRDIEPQEQELMTVLGVQNISAAEVKEIGVKAAFDMAFSALEGKIDALAVSIDLDGFDPQDAPAVGTPVKNGIRLAEFLPVWHDITSEKHIDLLEIAEYNPTLPGADTTYDAIVSILKQTVTL